MAVTARPSCIALALCAVLACRADAEPIDTRDDAALVDVAAAIPDAVIDLRYATADNITGAALYPKDARCKLRAAVARRLVAAADTLRAAHRRLLIWDCYRPHSVQDKLWKLKPDPRYVAPPTPGSVHNRGAAIDLAIVAADGSPVALPTKFDDFTAAAHRDRALATDHRDGDEARRLESAMTAAGFVGLPTEWWHYDDPGATKYPISDEPL